MMSTRRFLVAILFVASCTVGSARGQSSTREGGLNPIERGTSNLGGYAGRELNSIYRQSVGRGYSGSSINQITLSRTAARVPYVGQSQVAQGTGSYIARSSAPVSLGLSASVADKPFSSISARPTVSPYLNLFRDTLDDDVLPNYNTFVQPQLQQQQINERLRYQSQLLERRVQQIAAQPAYSIRGSESQAPTGHTAVYNFVGRYYPTLYRRRR